MSQYNSYVLQARREEAKGNHEQALRHIDAAIDACEVTEAFPELSIWRARTESKLPRPISDRLWRILNLRLRRPVETKK